MTSLTSHKVRQPIAHILGVPHLLDVRVDYSYEKFKKIIVYLKKISIEFLE